MRSSNKRSRNKNNRRSVGNVVNRVFDSSGPEGKVRGTPQQIIEKYQALARDAQLANDRVAVENFQQHAEHYTRMLAEAMREQEARREQQEQQQQQHNRNRDRQAQNAQRGGSEGQGANAPAPEAAKPAEAAPQPADGAPVFSAGASDVIDLAEDGGDNGLVDTPEAPAPEKTEPRKPRRSRARKPAAQLEEGPSDAAAE